MSEAACAWWIISRGVIDGLLARYLCTIIPAYYAVPTACSSYAHLVRLYGRDEALVVEAVLVELGELFVALGGDGFALGVGLHHDVHGPLYGHTRDHFLQHGDDVLHGRVVVVVQYDLVGRLLGDATLYLYPRLRLGRRGGRGRYAMQRWYASHCHLRVAELITSGKIPRRSRIRN